MIKILYDRWNENKGKLQKALEERTDLDELGYLELVKLSFDTIFNSSPNRYGENLDIKNIHAIDDGPYQGTLVYLIPFDTYQPSEADYLMTYVGYGSCSGCDTLLHIQAEYRAERLSAEKRIGMFMMLCLDIIRNTVRPYNNGWRYSAEFDTVDF